MNSSDLLRDKIARLPDKPGCYIMRDSSGKIIYVGKAVSLKKRVSNYFRPATLTRSDPKLRSLVKSIADFDFIVVRNEAEAVLTEGRMIKEYKPRFNILFKDDKNFPFIKTDPRDDYPRFSLCRLKREDGGLYFGPFTSSPATRAAIDFVEKKFGIRKCQPLIPDDNTYRHCINDIVRFCSAPCIGKVSREEYKKRFDDACSFLRGEKPSLLSELHTQMEEAAEALDYEKAGMLRDVYFKLKEIIEFRGRVAPDREMKKQDAQKGLDELKAILNLSESPECIEGFDISNISGTFSVASMVNFTHGLPNRNKYRRFRIKTVEGLNDPGMIAEAVRRRYDRLKKEDSAVPDIILVDGGITQRNAASEELRKLGVKVPVIALAKQKEQIYSFGSNEPMAVPDDSFAIKILQRIRDEAHRFALEYHSKLRNRRIKESVLDDIEGIGDSKKKALLVRFGSIDRIKKASEEQIALTKGIGYKMAKLIKQYLGNNALEND